MTYAITAEGALEYYPCRYGRSRVLFRGPRRPLEDPYIAFLGGTETYGRFIETPFPALIETAVGRPCVNLGVVNAGIDLYLGDPSALDTANRAAFCVVQVMGAQNMSNRFYGVHPRRNDRFLRASRLLQDLYPEVDFTEFHFTRHMLGRLKTIGPDRFQQVTEELRIAWVARMKHLLTVLQGRAILLWFADHPPPDTPADDLGGDPLLIDRSMIAALERRAAHVIEVPRSDAARALGTEGMVFTDFEAAAAAELMGPLAHEEAAEALIPVLRDCLSGYQP